MPLHRHVRPRYPLLAALVLLGALGMSSGVTAQQPVVQQQSTTVQQSNTASATNTGPGSQHVSQRQHNSATITNTDGSSAVTVTQSNTAQGGSPSQATSQTQVATQGGSQQQSTSQTQVSTSQTRVSQTTASAGAPPVTHVTEAVTLAAGCSNVVLSWPTGTALAEVTAAVMPSHALAAIFKLDAVEGRYRGYSPTAPAFANDYTAVEAALEAVFVCVHQGASLARPTS